MKHAGIIILGLIFFAFSGCVTSNTGSNITAVVVSEKPTVFCTVLKEPLPILIGGWQCRATGINASGKSFNNPVEYWLVKIDNQYALYYYFSSPINSLIGWQPFIIEDNEIRFSKDGKTPSSSQRKFMSENGKVYFVDPDGGKTEMNRIPEK